MEYPKLYLEWIDYLRKHKLYGLWIKDIVTYVESTIDTTIQNRQYEPIRGGNGGLWFNYNPPYTSFQKNELKSYLLGNKKQINGIISNFSIGSNYTKILMSGLRHTLNAISWKYKVSNVCWQEVYEEFTAKTRPTLSKGLSRKLSRTANKERSYKYKEKVEQPWYNKSYEKYNRKAWKK